MTAKVNKPLSPPEGQRQKSPPPQLSRDEISRRNARIMALFIAGHSEREIGRAVNLTGQRVHQIIKVELNERIKINTISAANSVPSTKCSFSEVTI